MPTLDVLVVQLAVALPTHSTPGLPPGLQRRLPPQLVSTLQLDTQCVDPLPHDCSSMQQTFPVPEQSALTAHSSCVEHPQSHDAQLKIGLCAGSTQQMSPCCPLLPLQVTLPHFVGGELQPAASVVNPPSPLPAPESLAVPLLLPLPPLPLLLPPPLPPPLLLLAPELEPEPDPLPPPLEPPPLLELVPPSLLLEVPAVKAEPPHAAPANPATNARTPTGSKARTRMSSLYRASRCTRPDARGVAKCTADDSGGEGSNGQRWHLECAWLRPAVACPTSPSSPPMAGQAMLPW